MSIFTVLGDVFDVGSQVAGAAQSPADQQLLTQIPVWQAAALKGDQTAYANLQCVAGNPQYGACTASGYVQGVAQGAVQVVDASGVIAYSAGQTAAGLSILGNAVSPSSFWSGFATTLGTSVANVQGIALLAVVLILWLVLRHD